MESEEYQGFRIDFEPQSSSHLPALVREYWFNVDDDAGPVFRVRMTVDPEFAHFRGGNPNALARELGLRWTHGLIDLDAFRRGRVHEESRGADWEPESAEEDTTDEDIRVQLLRALQRMSRAQEETSRILSLDVRGFSDVLGARFKRVRGMLSDLIGEGLAEPYGDTFGLRGVDGACRITREGHAALRSEGSRRVRRVYVDDIDSFAPVRDVQPGEVASLLKEGLLELPEARIKEALSSIVGEVFEHRDWGGERSDTFTTRLKVGGQRVPTAIVLKGPSAGPVLYPARLGKRGDQDLRLFTEPADLFIIQANGRIDSAVEQRLRIHAEHHARESDRVWICTMDGVDTARVLRANGHL